MFSRMLCVFLLAAFVAGCIGDGEGKKAGNRSGAIDTARFTTSAPEQRTGSTIDTSTMSQPAADSVLVVTHTATISTTVGDIVIELYGRDAPKTVENFVGLARKKFFEKIGFHRAVPGFVIQAGDPNTRDTSNRSTWGQGGESLFGGEFADEVNPASPSRRRGYVVGVLAMANRGPNTNTSQFFIVTGQEGESLSRYNSYTIFGMVTKGMEVVKKIEATGLQGEIVGIPVRITAVKALDAAPLTGGR